MASERETIAAEVSEWERKAIDAEQRGDEGALPYCLKKWDDALDRRDASND